MQLPLARIIEILNLSVLGQLTLAAILGGAIGWEREQSGKEAGFRTNMLICVGSALLTILSLNIGEFFVGSDSLMADPSRLIAAIISGIGFLGAGTIIQARGTVTGLTTAATMWVVAGIGIAVGAREFIIATGTTLFVLLALIPLGMLEQWYIEAPKRWIKTTIRNDTAIIEETIDELQQSGFTVECKEISKKSNEEVEVLYEIQGTEDALKDLPRTLSEKVDIREVSLDPLPN